MKIAILSRKATLYSTARLVAACRQHGAEVTVLDPLRCVVKVSKKRPEVFHDGERVCGVDGVVPRIGASITFYGLAVLRQFEMMGVFPANESQAISRSRDKLRSLQLLSRYDIGIPPTAFARRREDVRSAIRRVGGAPVILKLLEGTQGKGVILAESVKSAESVLDAMSSLGQNFLIQAYIEEAQGTDYRAIVVGGRVVAAMSRRAGEGEFRSNLHRGGSAVGVELDGAYASTAVHAAEVLGLNIAGVDMIPSKEGPMVLEVNSSPGLEGIEAATRVDVAGAMVGFVLAHAPQGHPHTRGRG
ncbi:MAG TPA: 30S ribosomal protein S6--L-glutamate ligase [Thermoanaerobaculia bacterium]|jgi:ribosomal protein S6--L-glutamate ligase|nr:30S ribosomal protein S6--L-glutamate ligase [Thermoanaerobaculia bacterium]